MASKAWDPLYEFLDVGDPHAIIEAQRRHQEPAESDNEEESDSEDELTKELMAGFGYDEGDEESQPQGANSDDVPPNPTASTSQTSLSAPAPMPSTDNNFAQAAKDGENDSEQEFEDVPLDLPDSTATTTAPTEASLHASSPSSVIRRPGRPRKQLPTHNLNGLPIRRDADGIEMGYKEEAPAVHTYAWASDTIIPQDDPYFAKGCLRRMVFKSNPVPGHQQYKAQDAWFQKTTDTIDYPSAGDKLYDWCRTRRGVTGATEETLKDGKLPRHFILKMGPPHGPNGDATRVAERLEAVVNQYFCARLAKSYLTIAIEIPYISLAGMSYFENYINKIREVMEDKRIRNRLTIHLAPESAQKYLDCNPTTFHPKNIDHEAKWQTKIEDSRYIWALLQRRTMVPMPDDWKVERWCIDEAKRTFLMSSRATEDEQKDHISQSIEHVKQFIRSVR